MIVLVIFWNIIGLVIWCVVETNDTKIRYADFFEWVNPIWIYRNYKVNFFGTIMVCALYNLIFPYWVNFLLVL